MQEIDRKVAIADALTAAGDWGRAVDAWLDAARDADQPTFRLRAAYVAMDGNLVERAESILRALVQELPRNPDAHFALGILYWKSNRLQDARGAMQAGLAIEENQSILTILGGILRRLGDRQGARTLLERSVALRAEDEEAHFALGQTLGPDDPQAAAKHFRRVLEIEPRFRHVRRELGSVLWRLGQSDEAEELLRTAIIEDPADAWAHDYLGHLVYRRSEWQDAHDEFLSATKCEPSIGMFWSDLARAQARLGLFAEAERSYIKALSLGVDDAHTHARYGLLLRDSGRLSKARMYLERALKLDPSLNGARKALDQLNREKLS